MEIAMKELELGSLVLLGIAITIYYIICIFNTTYMEVIRSQCTGIKHKNKNLIAFFGLIEAVFILGGLLFTEKYVIFFVILLIWNLLWSFVNSCKLGSDIKLYRFYVTMSFIINLFITSILSIWLNEILK